MPKRISPLDDLNDLLPAAQLLAVDGVILSDGLWAYHTAFAAAAGLPPAKRRAAVRAALAKLVEDDLVAALHGLAAAIRAEKEATAQARVPSVSLR